ncbi:MAG: T9SS type A sorting domain-containing protein, partial [Flavobacteriales bacterium]|nr:T9SS type A sorting domain-containing protein [Flavobacteriales bacterium]
SVGDYDNDGWLDLFTSDIDSCKLLRNMGNGTFEDRTLEEGLDFEAFTWSGLFMDADNDMDLDLHISTYGSHNRFMENISGAASFVDASTAWGFQFDFDDEASGAFGDVNGDGHPDFSSIEQYAPDIDNRHSLWINQGTTGNHFLKFRLVGTTSNRMAVGSVIRVYTDGIQQMRRVGCGENFASQNSYVQHFGMASYSVADSIHILWPDGLDTTLYDIAVDQTLTLIEGNEVFGCTDPEACNYEPESTWDDGSCQYIETSGIQGDTMPTIEQVYIYTFDLLEGFDYLWEIAGGDILSGQGTHEVEVVWNSSETGLLTLTISGPDSCMAQYSLVTQNVLSSLEDQVVWNFRIYPNPSDGHELFMVFSRIGGSEYPIGIEILDTSGRVMAEQILTKKSNNQLTRIEFDQKLQQGIYIVRYSEGDYMNYSKVVVD